MSQRFILIPITLLVLQAGCAKLTKADCDPSKELGAITKTRCLTGGVYDERVQELELSVEEQAAIKRDLEVTLAAVQKESGEVRTEVQNKKQEYAQLNAAVNSLLARLRTKAANNAGLQKSIREIEAKLAEVNQPQADAGTLQKQAQLDELKQQLAGLQKELGQ
ncbi:MAG: hypothetical protein ACT4PZ_02560 [Panacagrimonas sp.]